jgi:hypothetical protein
VYFSAPFETNIMSDPPFQVRFSTFLEQKYAYRGMVICNSADDLEEAQIEKKTRIKRLKPYKKIVETNWNFPEK